MGCCETRDEKKPIKKPPKLNVNGRNKDLNLISLQDQDLVSIPEKSPLSRNLNHNKDSGSMSLYVEWCRSVKKWGELAEFTSDDTAITEPQVYINWASKPTTLGSLAVVYLCIEMRKDPSTVYLSIESVIKDLIFLIPVKSIDYQENVMLLFYYFLDWANEKIIRVLVKFGVYGVINKFLTAERWEMRHLTVCTCWKMYKNRVYAQEEFLNYNGGFKLLGIIGSSAQVGEDFLGSVVVALTDLFCCDGDFETLHNLNRVNTEMLWEEFDKLNKEGLSISLMEKIDILLGLIGTSDST